jgi:hypothetical protein
MPRNVVLRGAPWRFRSVSGDVDVDVDSLPEELAVPHMESWVFIQHVTTVVRALDSARFLHGDLKWDNVIVSSAGDPFIIDLDMGTWEARSLEERKACFPGAEQKLRFDEVSVGHFEADKGVVLFVEDDMDQFVDALQSTVFIPLWDLAYFTATLCLAVGDVFVEGHPFMWFHKCVFRHDRLVAAGVCSSMLLRVLFRVQGRSAAKAVEYFVHSDACDRVDALVLSIRNRMS